MITVSTKNAGMTLEITLKGVIDDSTDLTRLLGIPADRDIRFFTREITRINSAGLKKMRSYFQSLCLAGKSVTFLEVSSPLVSQLSMVRDLFAGCEVESICLCYFCEACGKEELQVSRIAELREAAFTPPVKVCPACSKPMEFDDLPEEYFGYWLN